MLLINESLVIFLSNFAYISNTNDSTLKSLRKGNDENMCKKSFVLLT